MSLPIGYISFFNNFLISWPCYVKKTVLLSTLYCHALLRYFKCFFCFIKIKDNLTFTFNFFSHLFIYFQFILTGCFPLFMTEQRKSSWKCLVRTSYIGSLIKKNQFQKFYNEKISLYDLKIHFEDLC